MRNRAALGDRHDPACPAGVFRANLITIFPNPLSRSGVIESSSLKSHPGRVGIEAQKISLLWGVSLYLSHPL
jgi:hypothetical protein